VAVGAQQEQVLETIVTAVTVDMMEFERERPSTPFAQTALLAPVLLQSRSEQPELDVVAVATPVSAKQRLKGLEAGAR